MKRRLITAILLISLVQSIAPVPARAAWDVTVNIDGVTVVETDPSLKPYIDEENGRVMLSVRSVTRALGGGVDWVRYYDGTIRIRVKNRDKSVQLWTGDRVAQVDGRWHELYAAPVVSAQGRVFLGMRDLFNLLEIPIGWDLDHRIASAFTDKVELMEASEFDRVEEFFQTHGLVWDRLDGDIPEFEVSDLAGPDSVVFPAPIRPHHVAQYLRSIEDANYMTRSYEEMYAYADPPHPILPAGAAQPSESVLALPQYASARAMVDQRHLAGEQARLTLNDQGRRAVDTLSQVMRRYKTPDGIYVEVTPGGERQWMNKGQALELYSTFHRAGSFFGMAATLMFTSGGVLLGIKTLARAWPYGTLFAGVLLAATTWHYNELAGKIKDVCLPGGGDKGIEYVQKYIRVPSGIWSKLEESSRDQSSVDHRVGRVILTIPATCHAWNGGMPW